MHALPPPPRTSQGVNVTALREVKLLRELRSPYLVRLLDVLPQRRGLALVMEYCEADLEQLVRDRSRVLSAGDVKAYLQVRGSRPLGHTGLGHPLWRRSHGLGSAAAALCNLFLLERRR